MAYKKQTFVDRIVDESGAVTQEGTTLKADHLNHIEEGIAAVETELGNKQPKGNYLTEHQKIKTINGQSLVGEGDIAIGGVSSYMELSDTPGGYTETAWVEKVPSMTVTTTNGEKWPLRWNEFPFGEDEGGLKCKVVWDGVEYECVVMVHDGGGTYLGDLVTTPFKIVYMVVEQENTIYTTDPDGEHTISIYKEEDVVVPIDEKYLPGPSPLVLHINAWNTPYTCDVPFEDVLTAFGKRPIVIMMDTGMVTHQYTDCVMYRGDTDADTYLSFNGDMHEYSVTGLRLELNG